MSVFVGPVSPYQVATTNISSAQILALATTGVVLVPAVTGQAIIPVDFSLDYIAGSTAYTDNGGNLAIATAASVTSGATGTWFSAASAGFWDQTTSQAKIGTIGGAIGAAVASLNGMLVRIRQTSANPTIGNGTMTVTITYRLVALS